MIELEQNTFTNQSRNGDNIAIHRIQKIFSPFRQYVPSSI